MLNWAKDLTVSVALVLALSTAAPISAAEPAGSGGINAPEQRDKPYVVVISIDGFRWDYQADNDTPALDRIAAAGIRAESLEPVYPTLTFPNHYSIATGLYPAEHGIVTNEFMNEARDDWYVYKKRETVQDGTWYRGDPFWTVAERNGLVTASFFFVGTEAPINGIAPTYWNLFDASVPGETRIEQTLHWLSMPKEKRPHLITLYFEDVDVATHDFAPGSTESRNAIRQVDQYIGDLLDGIDALDIRDEIYLMILSDHGQIAASKEHEPLLLNEIIDLEGLSIVDSATSIQLYLDRPDKARATHIRDTINQHWQHGRAYLREETPEHWRMRKSQRFPDIIVQAEPHHAVLSHPDKAYNLKPGGHGLDPREKDMHGIFLAYGPGLPKGKIIGTISAVDIYPLVLQILDLPDPTADHSEVPVLKKYLTETAP